MNTLSISDTPLRSPDTKDLQTRLKLENESQKISGLTPKATNAQLKQTAQDFEATFLSQMMEHMFAGIETDELTGGGEAEDIYRSMMVDEYGKLIAKRGGIGVADHVMSHYLKNQEVTE